MPEVLKEGDFVELDYTGKILEGDIIFDTTLEDVAKQNNLHDPKAKYEPVIICLGKNHVIAGLDKNLAGKEIGKTYVFEIPPEEGFGNKDPKKIQLISTSKFREQKITPMPGLQVNLDGILGTIKAVSGGRTIVDFNHPLSGKDLKYEVTVKRIVTDLNEKIDATLKLLGINMEKEILADKLTLKSPEEVPKEMQENLTKIITETVKEIKTVSFEQVTKKSEPSGQTNNKI
ncbi:peptidylprolyl isomerase [Candidatus Woesearchaeota archaeon]|nr:peptidylprolyl isomerase [Candidatus Woesearchaeota archaeon]|tara:strand:- start:38633 stop:39325 length:693 start_codon:yes stop_codon:yes gene_type:complete